MGKKKENLQETKAIVAEFSVSMHCKACERVVAKAISKLKGVEKFMTDMNNHKVVVTGKFEPQKVLKKLKKKTGKRVEILFNENQDKSNIKKIEHEQERYRSREAEKEIVIDFCDEFFTTIFSDENPNSCYVM